MKTPVTNTNDPAVERNISRSDMDIVIAVADIIPELNEVPTKLATIQTLEASIVDKASEIATNTLIVQSETATTVINAASALASKNAAELSEINASNSANSASISKDNALASAVSANDSAQSALASKDSANLSAVSASASESVATTRASEASVSASNALTYKNEAQAIRDSIEDITATATTLTASSSATASFDTLTNVLSLGIPQGIKGDTGLQGPQGIQGIQGVHGDTGNGIASVIKTSGTGAAGTTDTYTITFTDATTTTFNVYNGADGTAAGDMLKLVYDTNNSGVVDSSEKLATARNINGVAFDGTADITIYDATKQEVLISGTNIKTINGTDILGSGNLEVTVGSGGYAANVYLTSLVSSTVGTYNQISYTPEPTQTIISAIANNNEVLMADYIFDGDVVTTYIPAGEWVFHYHSRVDNTAGNSFVRFELFKRSNLGVETILFSHTSNSIENTAYEQSVVTVTQPAYPVVETDRIGIKVYGSTTRTNNTTIEMLVGDGSASYFSTPLQIRHNQLRVRDAVDSHPISAITNLQIELDNRVVKNSNITAGTNTKITYDAKGLVTSATSLVATDIPVLDTSKITTGLLPVARGGTGVSTSTGSGNIVFSTSPVFTTPNIGVATGTSFNSITGLASGAPLIAGTAAVGTSTLTARQDHVHPAQTTVSGNAGTATTLATPRNLTIGSTAKAFNGSLDVAWSLAEIGAQPVDADLTAIGALAGTSGLLKKTAANTWALDTSAYVTSSGVISVGATLPLTSTGGNTPTLAINNVTTTTNGAMSASDKVKLDSIATNANIGTVTSIATSGAITGGTITGTGTISHSSADGFLHVPATGTTNNGKVLTAGATAGSFSWVTPTAGVTDHTLLSNIGTNTHTQIDIALTRLANTSGTNTGDQTITLTGDVTGSGTSSFATTLANSGVTAGTYSKVTVDGKGRVTAGTNPITLAGFGIADAYTKTDIDLLIGDINSALDTINGQVI